MPYLFTFFTFINMFSPVLLIKISVNASENTYPIPKFWKSTGFSPPKSDEISVKEYILSKEVEINLALISSLPQQGIEYVRIHWLLSLISELSDGSIDWKDLDTIIERVVGNGLKPIFELMGNSTFLINRSRGSTFWKHLTSQLINRYIEKFGYDEVSQWKFETWNEPDLKMYNALNFTIDEFINYVDGSIEGVKSALPSVEVGGPAGLFKNKDRHPLCWGFLNYCNGSDSRCNLDYISLHRKGNGTSSEILNGTLEMRKILTKDYLNLANLPIVNDEADILTGWWKPEEWRGDAQYAAAVVKTVFLFKTHFKISNVKRISIDNGFINEPPNFFNQRTLLTRFVGDDGSNMFVQKPVYAGMGLLALLGDEEIPANFSGDDRFSLFVTCTKNKAKSEILSLSILLAFSSDNMEVNKSSTKLKYKLILPNLWKNARYTLYTLNNELPSPKSIWEKNGRPSVPTKSLLKILQNNQEPHSVIQGKLNGRVLKKTYRIPQPGIAFLHVCSSNIKKPGKVRNVRAYNMSYNEVLLTWREASLTTRCIKTFTVEHSKITSIQPHYAKINEVDIIFNSFNYIYSEHLKTGDGESEKTLGLYRVAAIDFWGRLGEYSDPILYNT